MSALASVVFFAVALILELAGISKGHVDWLTFELAGLLCLALAGGTCVAVAEMSMCSQGLAALLLAASLILEAAARQVPLGRWLAVAGLVFLILAVLVPYRPRPPEVHVSEQPHFGHTRHGLPVHARTADHHPDGSAYQRFNKRVAVWLTDHVGTMTCFWIFCGLALCSLPAVLSGFSAFSEVFPDWMVRASDIALVAWIAQTFIQLVLLPGLMVGQSLQNAASDARAAKQFEDTEQVRADLITALDRLDDKTEGGLKTVLDAVNTLASQVAPRRRLATQAERDNKGDPAGG